MSTKSVDLVTENSNKKLLELCNRLRNLQFSNHLAEGILNELEMALLDDYSKAQLFEHLTSCLDSICPSDNEKKLQIVQILEDYLIEEE